MPIRYSDAVEAAIAEVCPPRDAFDAPDFDPVQYLNSRFPDEASLSAVPVFLEEAQERLRRADNDILKAVEQQASRAATAEKDLRGAKDAVAQLYKRVSAIKDQASLSEETVKELCEHIRELDIAKTNLTVSINTLRSVQLWMLQLQVLSSSFEKRHFLQTRDALQEAKKYSAMFETMKHITKVKELNDKQTQLCRQIEYYIRNTIFGEFSLESMDESLMAEACSVVDLMDEESVKKLREKFIDKVLETYTTRFRRGTDDATLERTERRYVYIRTLLEQYERVFQNVFPRHWCVPQELCVTFCLRTKQELDFQLREAAGTIDMVVLTYVLQKTIDMERDLTQMLAWKEEFQGRRELPVYKYNGLILSAFKQHMGLYVKNEDELMRDALSQPLIGSGDAACPGWNTTEEEIRVGTALPIAEDIFVFIKESLKRALRIAQQDVLLEMAGVWRQHLIQFAASIATVLPSPAISPLDVRRACIILNTADLCQSTSQDLGDEVCARSEAPPREVGFDTVADAFSALYSKAVQSILHGVEVSLAPLLLEYGNGCFIRKPGGGGGAGGDGFDGLSGGATDETRQVRAMATILHDVVLHCSATIQPMAFRFLLEKVAAAVIPQYGNCLYRLRRLPDDAVGVMRVDAAAFEKVFLQLPNYNDPTRFTSTAVAGYMKLVRREFDRMNRSLKVLQVDTRSDAFVDVYYEVILPEDRSIHNFVRLVELKGLRREDVRPWINSLSKRGVVEATKRDMTREASLGLSTGATAIGAGAATTTSTTGGINFAALFSRDPAAASTGAPPPTTATATAGQNGGVDDESLGSRFANVARSTATSISFLKKFKKSEGS